MPRKYINRAQKKSAVSSNDEWTHITEVEDGSNLEIKDALDIQERRITLSQEKEKNRTPFEKIKEETRNAMDVAGNTGQYIRFVKLHIDKQKKEIDKIKKIRERFDSEIDLLQSQKPDFSKINLNNLEKFNVDTVTQFLEGLLSEKGNTKKKLDVLKSEILEVEKVLEKQENQIEDLNEELVQKRNSEKEHNNEVGIIKEDIEELISKYGIANLSKALKSAKE